MNNTWYVVVGIALIVIPAIAAWKRRWWAFAVYVIGSLVFLNEAIKGNGGWDALADFATLIIIVIPIYIVATIVWIAGTLRDRSRRKS